MLKETKTGRKCLVNPLKSQMEKESRKTGNTEATLAYLPLQVRGDVSNLNSPAPVKVKAHTKTLSPGHKT